MTGQYAQKFHKVGYNYYLCVKKVFLLLKIKESRRTVEGKTEGNEGNDTLTILTWQRKEGEWELFFGFPTISVPNF